MSDEILPPTSDEVKFFATTLRLSPVAHAKVEARKKATGLTKEKMFACLLQTAHAALDGDAALVAKWKAYYDALVKAAIKPA